MKISMLLDFIYQFLGPFSIALTWLGLFSVIKRWPGKSSMSLSQHAAQTKGGQIVYFILFFTTLPLFYLFVTHWFVPVMKLPPLYIYLTTVGMIGQLIAAAFPAVRGWKEKVHNVGAYTMAFMLIPLTFLLMYADLPVAIKLFAVIGSLYMLTTIVFTLTTKLIKPKYLYFQTAYIAVFHVLILVSIYTRSI